MLIISISLKLNLQSSHVSEVFFYLNEKLCLMCIRMCACVHVPLCHSKYYMERNLRIPQRTPTYFIFTHFIFRERNCEITKPLVQLKNTEHSFNFISYKYPSAAAAVGFLPFQNTNRAYRYCNVLTKILHKTAGLDVKLYKI